MTEQKKPTPAAIIELLVQCINQQDQGAFYQWAETYQKGLAPGGEAHARISRLLRARPRSMSLLDSLQGKMLGLVAQHVPEEENVFISAASRSFLDPLLTEWNNRALYSYHNLGVRTKVLLYGPSGNGKTTMARYLARRMGLPLIEVKADSIIDSRMGSTGRNINLIFENLKEPCILFWDEVDSIGRRRGGLGQDKGVEVENEGMVNFPAAGRVPPAAGRVRAHRLRAPGQLLRRAPGRRRRRPRFYRPPGNGWPLRATFSEKLTLKPGGVVSMCERFVYLTGRGPYAIQYPFISS